MKFSGSIDINKSRTEVVEYFADPTYLGEYQDGFIRKELISGEMGQADSVSNMYYKYGKHEMELTETITANKLPDSFEAYYHHKHMDNTMKCTFIEVDDHTTRYQYAFDYIRINWFLPKLIAIIYPGMYRKQGEKWLMQFKEFVENQ